ncbi:beta-galactosidase/beta-glucuronidase [Pedobacter sp. CAN_A7]|uniref:glycoside hydrolase family 2 TIM barrel-domain containing protein n=1 Tax=Pedobacter sp. CAN_A7 TaxID=2787722 RepID=UPI0018CBDC50
MKKIYILFVLTTILCPIFSAAQDDATGYTLFNEGWKFQKGDVKGGEAIKFNDQQWRSLSLPHDWSIEGPFSSEWASSTGYLPAGIGWYRKTFTLTQQQQSGKVFIYFDGVYKNSEVWINGHYLGKRPNGYTPFQYELSPYLNKTGNNVIAVKADHTKYADSRWYPGSGIYRNVYLIAKEKVYIPTWGVSFTTPEVTAAQAMAKVDVKLQNSTTATTTVVVKTSLADSKGKVVASKDQQLAVKAGEEATATLSLPVVSPALWSDDKPELYRLSVSVFQNGKTIDQYTEKVGFRTIKFDAEEGFFLNGKNMKIKGVCIHHDAGALGAAVPREVWARRLQIMKEVGCNAIRMSHYPHQDYLYELCDEMGFLVMDEAFDEWARGKNKWVEGWNVGTPTKDGYHEDFAEWADRDLGDMVKRNRNHPSIIMWSIGNEIDYPNDPYTHEVLNTGRNPQIYGKGFIKNNPPASELAEIASRLVKVVKQLDDTRPVTAALAGVVMSNMTDYPDLLDLVGYNYQEYRYADDHKAYPKRIIYGSENGKGKKEWVAVDTSKNVFGQFLWTGFDFVGEARKWPVRSSGAGLANMAGFPKNDYFVRQSLWSAKPMAYLMVANNGEKEANRFMWNADAKWNWKDGEQVKVGAVTNADEAELFLNGTSLGKKSADGDDYPMWDLKYQAGTLLLKAYNKGEEVATYSLVTAGRATVISTKVDRADFDQAKKGVSHIEIELKDAKGNLVYDSENEISVSIEGPAKLLGLESGKLDSHESYQSPQRKVYRGKLLAYIQSDAKPGTIKVTLSGEGLGEKTITYQSK